MKECVDGVRRVWGRMKVITSTSLYSVITKPSNIENKSKLSNVEIKFMNIKRKTIMNSDGGLQGGGHAPESVLKCLDSEWEDAYWMELEPCFKPVFISDNTSASDDSTAAKVSDAHEAHDVMYLSTTTDNTIHPPDHHFH